MQPRTCPRVPACVCVLGRVCACMHGRLRVCGAAGKVRRTESESRPVAAGPRALRLRGEVERATADSC